MCTATSAALATGHLHVHARCLPVWAPSTQQIRIDLHTGTQQTHTHIHSSVHGRKPTPKDSSIDSSKSTSRLRCHRGHTHVVWHPHLFGIFDIDVDCRLSIADGAMARCRCWMTATTCALNVSAAFAWSILPQWDERCLIASEYV